MKRKKHLLTLLFTLIAPLTVWPQITTNIKNIGDSCSYYYDTLTARNVFLVVDKAPSYQGGYDTIRNLIRKNLRWPASGCDFAGTVFVGFIIEPDGSVSNKKIIRGIDNSEYCNVDAEAIKVLDFLTDWIPGKCHGEAVPVRFALPIKFKT